MNTKFSFSPFMSVALSQLFDKSIAVPDFHKDPTHFNLVLLVQVVLAWLEFSETFLNPRVLSSLQKRRTLELRMGKDGSCQCTRSTLLRVP